VSAVATSETMFTLAERGGVWCDACALPSVIERDIDIVSLGDLETLAKITLGVCQDCDAWTKEYRDV